MMSFVFFRGRWAGFGRGGRTRERRSRNAGEERLAGRNACQTDPADRQAGSLHKIPFAIMRYNRQTPYSKHVRSHGRRERTQKKFYVKARMHDAPQRLTAGSAGKKGTDKAGNGIYNNFSKELLNSLASQFLFEYSPISSEDQ